MPSARTVVVMDLYTQLKKLGSRDLRAPAVGDVLSDIFEQSLGFLKPLNRVALATAIPGKSYFAFENAEGKISRPVNEVLYRPSLAGWRRLVTALRNDDFSNTDPDAVTRAIYCAAMSFCAVIDLTKSRDQKTPGTFFEYLIGHLFAARLGTNPTTRLPVLNLDMETTLPTDFTFDLGPGRPKFHLPVKTSTRERVIQIWAHQRVLDGVYGTGRFLGTPVFLTETKNDQTRREVVEICLPDQWRIYQMHISQLKRVYYLDMPAAYAGLAELFPPIHVAPFGQFFFEVAELSA